MLKISGAYNQLTKILSWRGWRKNGEPLPEENDSDTVTTTTDHPQRPMKKKKSSLRRLTKMIKRKTKDSVSKEKLVTAVDHGSSEEKMPPVEPQQTLQLAAYNYETRLKTNDDSDEGACAKAASDAEFAAELNLQLALATSQDESDDDSLLNSSGDIFFLDVALKQPLNTSIEVLEEVHTLLTDIARINRDSQVLVRHRAWEKCKHFILVYVYRRELVKSDFIGRAQLNAMATKIPGGN